MSRTPRTPDVALISPLVSRWWAPALVAALLATGACRDSPTDLLPAVVTAETQPALALGVVLPDPADWAAWGTDDSAGRTALTAWRSSWDLQPDRGREVRERSYDALVALLPADRRGVAADEDLATLQRALTDARALPADALPPSVRAGLARAASEAAAAAGTRDRAGEVGTLVHVLRGADALREVGPEAVARTLVGEVERKMRRIRSSDAYSPTDVERLQRLVQGGRQAVEQGDWVLAIRRAYYARALLISH